jgi:hypothetical protein
MRAIGRIGIGALGLVSLACGQGTPGQTCAGGTGGGRGGAGGGSAGTGETRGAVDLELPACVQALVASCPTSGTCVSPPTDAATQSPLYFSSGVRVTIEGEITGTSGIVVASVSNADGTPCYSFQRSVIGGEVWRYVWKDPAGQVVATGRMGFDPLDPPPPPGTTLPYVEIQCESGGQTSGCSDGCCDIGQFGNATCAGQRITCATGTCR